MTKRIIFMISTCLAVGFALPAAAAREATVLAQSGKNGMGIAAVVGGDAISSYELENRLRFILTTARMSNTPEVIERIRPQIARALVDEKLQLQEATQNGIIVSDAEIQQAIAGVEQQRGMRPGAIFQMLEANRIPRQTFTDQIHTQIAWSKLLAKKIKPQIRISDEEVRLAAKRFTLPPAQKLKELQIAVLQLPVDKPARDAETRKLADRLVGEVRAGASFEEVSRQFSSSVATSGGKVDSFWVRPEQLDPAVARALQAASEGMITEPVRTQEGYTIIKVYKTRALGEEKPSNMAVAIKEILLKLKSDVSAKEADAMLQIGEEVAKHPGSCEEKGIASVDNLDDFDIEVNIYNTMMSELPPAVKTIATNLDVGGISTPYASDEGIRLYMLCDKKEGNGKLDRERVMAMLFQQKMGLAAQKYLHDLRRDVFTDVR